VNLTCINTRPKFNKKYNSFYVKWTYVQGTHPDAGDPYSLRISDYRIYELFWYYVPVISKIYFREFQSNIHFMVQLSSLPHKIICIKTVLRQKPSQIWLFVCRFFFPMPQLTPNCDRVVVIGFRPSDDMDYNTVFAIRLFQMLMEIRISEDYWLSDIYVFDFGNATLDHVSKINPTWVKKFELCCLVSSTYVFCIYKDNSAQ